MMKRLLLLLTLIALLLVAAPAFAQTSTQTPTTTPTPTASATPDPNCERLPAIRLIVRERARVTLEDDRPLNIRERPSTDAEVLSTLLPGQIVYVLDGPICSTTYAWFQIEYSDIIGWIAEGTSELYFVEVFPPGE